MVNTYKICYIAQYPNGKLLDPKNPYLEANILTSTKKEAISNLMLEFPGLKINVVEDPQQSTLEKLPEV